VKRILLLALVALAGCRAGPTDSAMEALTRELDEAFPNEIAAISFENAPPLDPPTIFVDTKPDITREETVAWLCVSVRPRVDAVDSRIDVFTTYGDLRIDCP
jgi:hypothetical protein